MNLIKKIFYPNIVPKIKNQIAGYNINNNVKKALGVLSIHFWAPTFKWSISLANLVDINRDPKLLSLPQQFVNLFMSLTALYQITRIANYKYNASSKKEVET
ncbi:hypothetical protein POVWA2_043280 [Plasmodium ovale wallikeri]|uniref:Mitochondrial pyruvate carrier n=1 Tax=Plasmodium ovale wallikeri TaxID=864142 RepID=A0A1A8ZEC2_PLAOA|nr:hypothetical protein POVWA1_044690 [Plasmodium ovale wallikeri]SBT42149.1 hypothetical protein POVWA2_043280 [Plasmodium ovale wallikeri]